MFFTFVSYLFQINKNVNISLLSNWNNVQSLQKKSPIHISINVTNRPIVKVNLKVPMLMNYKVWSLGSQNPGLFSSTMILLWQSFSQVKDIPRENTIINKSRKFSVLVCGSDRLSNQKLKLLCWVSLIWNAWSGYQIWAFFLFEDKSLILNLPWATSFI